MAKILFFQFKFFHFFPPVIFYFNSELNNILLYCFPPVSLFEKSFFGIVIVMGVFLYRIFNDSFFNKQLEKILAKGKVKMNWKIKIKLIDILNLLLFKNTMSPIIEKTTFTHLVDKDDVILEWEGNLKNDNSKFRLERKNFDSREWSEIACIDNSQGLYNSKIFLYDFGLSEGIYNYRVKKENNVVTYYELNSPVIIVKSMNLENEDSRDGKFILYQKYTNKYDSTVAIKFILPKRSNARLTIYDDHTRTVSIVVDKKLRAGNYEYEIPVGQDELLEGKIYYGLEACGYSEIKEMKYVNINHYEKYSICSSENESRKGITAGHIPENVLSAFRYKYS